MEGLAAPISPQADADARAARNQHYQVLEELAECYAALSDYGRARKHYTQAAALDPNTGAPYVGLGVIAIQAGRLDEAERAFRIAAGIQPDCAEAYGGLAIVHQQRRRYPAAFEAYLRCLELNGDNLVALLGLFQTSCKMGTFSKIIHYLEVYLDKHPGDASVLFCLSTLYAREGKLGLARQTLLDVLALEPEKADAAELLKEVEAALSEFRLREA